jgi:hypothetical protein
MSFELPYIGNFKLHGYYIMRYVKIAPIVLLILAVGFTIGRISKNQKPIDSVLDHEKLFSGSMNSSESQLLLDKWIENEQMRMISVLNSFADMPATDKISDDIKLNISHAMLSHPYLTEGIETLSLASATEQKMENRDACLQVIEYLIYETLPSVAKILENTMQNETDRGLLERKQAVVDSIEKVE